jgi:hypothetical protein
LTQEAMISIEDASKQVELVCRRLGLLHLAYAQALVEELGPEAGERLAAKAIKRYARWIGSAKRDKAGKAGMELSPESFAALSDLPTFGMHSRYEEVEVEGEARSRAYGCAMGNVWREMGEERLGRIYCHVDPANSMAFSPDFKLVHTMAMPDGDPHCEFAFRPTSARDRELFDSEDTDWAEIERG